MEQIVERRCPSRSVPPHLYIHAPGDTRSDTGARHVTSPYGRKMHRVHKQNTNQEVSGWVLTDRQTDRRTDTTTQTRSERERERARACTHPLDDTAECERIEVFHNTLAHPPDCCLPSIVAVCIKPPPPPPENTHARHTHTHKWTANQQIGARAKEEKETDKRRTGTIVRANFPRWDTIQRAQDCAWARTHARTHAHTHTHARKHFHRRASGGYSPPACAAPNTPPVEAPEAPPAAG
jgi:hypothetical protein